MLETDLFGINTPSDRRYKFNVIGKSQIKTRVFKRSKHFSFVCWNLCSTNANRILSRLTLQMGMWYFTLQRQRYEHSISQVLIYSWRFIYFFIFISNWFHFNFIRNCYTSSAPRPAKKIGPEWCWTCRNCKQNSYQYVRCTKDSDCKDALERAVKYHKYETICCYIIHFKCNKLTGCDN